MSSACKNIITELNRGEKLEGDNYDIWYRKVQYVLEEQEVKETLFHLMEEPEQGTTAQHKRDQEAYNAWKRKNSIARITLLSCMQDDLMCEFEEYESAKGIWEALKEKFGATSATKVRRLNQKFNDYKKRPNKSMRQHLRVMSNMIRELRTAGQIMSDEQQVQTVLRSLPESWDHMKIQMTHNDNVKTFEDISRHLELEDERLEAAKPFNEANYASSSSGMKRKRSNFGNKASEQPNPKKQKRHAKRGKKGGKKDKTKMKCYNCDTLGHFARECTEAKKVLSLENSRKYAYVSSCVMLAESNPLWIVDSGATDHVARSREVFTEYRRIPKGTRWLYVGNNTKVAVIGIGTCQLHMRGGKNLILHDVLYAPEIRRDLVSVLALLRLGFSLNFYDMGLHISLDSVFFGYGYTYDGFIVLDCNTTTSSNNNDCFSFVTSSTTIDMDVWHARLCHIGVDRMKRLAKEGLLGSLARIDLNTCESCLAGKAIRKPFGKATRAEYPLQLIHSDICGPMNVRARHGASYFITFTDDYTRFGHVYLISHKSEALECFRRYVTLVENQLDKTIKCLRTDRGGEYLSEQFKELCDEKGIVRQLTTPYTPQQNGVSERRNRTLLEMVRSMMAQANLPVSYWGDALLTAAYVLNLVPSKSVTSTPYELWTGRKHVLAHLKPWGSVAFVRDISHPHGKLGPRGKKCIFIRYSEHSKGYVLIGEQTDGSVTEIESRDVTFLENEFPKKGEIDKEFHLREIIDPSNTSPTIQPMEVDANSNDLPQLSGRNTLVDDSSLMKSQEFEMRRSNRGKIPRRRFEIEGEAFMVALHDDLEPKSVHEALSCPNSEKWNSAIGEELDSMKVNHVWDLVDLPPDRRAIGNKWVFKIKYKADGSIDRYKARLVAKGYTQQEGIDYEETFSPVVRFASIRLILSIVAGLDLELHQMDVKTAFLNGELEEEIYMEQPNGFIVKGQENKVCKLKRSIYGLKQSSRQWYFRFHRAITSYDFTMINEDHCVYVKNTGQSFVILSLYVDDILLAGNNMEFLTTIKEWLSSNFEMKDIGEADYVLGVKIHRDRSRRLLALSQESYIRKILERFKMHTCNPIDTPIAKGEGLSLSMCPKTPDKKKEMEKVPYASAVGSLMYAMMCTRPDICYAVGLVSRYQSNPGKKHWMAVKRILRYLKGTMDYSLCYQGSNLHLTGYSDADWASDLDERRSTSGYTFLLSDGAITWSSKKQSCTALSTMEAEFMACSASVQEAVWLRSFLQSLNVTPNPSHPVMIHCDNQACIAYMKDPKYHGRTKHIEIKHSFVRDIVAKKEVILKYISTHKMVADPFTKPIPRDVFNVHVRALGLRRI